MASAWKAPLTTAVTIVAVAGLGWGYRFLQSNDVDLGRVRPMQVGYYFLSALPLFFIGAVLYAVRGTPRVLVICAGCGVMHIFASALARAAQPGEMGSIDLFARVVYGLGLSLASATYAWIVVPLAVLAMYRFRGKLERVRLGAMVSTAATMVLQIATVWTYSQWVEFFSHLSILATVVFGMMAAWCLAFRRVAENRPPIDATGAVSLTCPRCASAQEIKNGHGACTRCRLNIWISLNEGVCRKCRYPLRGLTGENCPECGTAIAEAEAAGVATNA